MQAGSLVRFSSGYGSDTFEVVAKYSKWVALKALASTAVHEAGEVFLAEADDLWTYRK